jgi:hypothetical protein
MVRGSRPSPRLTGYDEATRRIRMKAEAVQAELGCCKPSKASSRES